MRIMNHPILGKIEDRQKVSFLYDGRIYDGFEGEPVAAALYAAGVKIHSYSHKAKRPRGIFCMIGKCTDCVMVVNGQPNIRTCVTPLQNGMVIQTQHGNGINPDSEQETV